MKRLLLILVTLSGLSLEAIAEECSIPYIEAKIENKIRNSIREEMKIKKINWDESTFTMTQTHLGFEVSFKVGSVIVSAIKHEGYPPYSHTLSYKEWGTVREYKDSMGDVYKRVCNASANVSFSLLNESNGYIISYMDLSLSEEFELDVH